MQNVVIGFLGTQLDRGKRKLWKPSVSLVQHQSFKVARLELIYSERFQDLAESVRREIQRQDPDVDVLLQRLDLVDPWDFQEVYGKLFDFAAGYGFDEDREAYHVHLTTGTHVAQICWFLLTESRHIPARLVQTGPPRGDGAKPTLDIVDLDLSRYNALQQRFDQQSRAFSDQLKGGIGTRNKAYNQLIDRLELVASQSDGPILLTGETGVGKSDLAERIYDLKLQRRRVKGRLVPVNCASLRGPDAAAMLFGQRRSYLGQPGTERGGLLREADGGVLFLDEIDELGRAEQSLLLNALETGRYYPLGADHEVTSRFHIIAGSNRDLEEMAAEGRFRPDLLARLSMWRFDLPPLRARREDVEANLHFELERAERHLSTQVGFNADAHALFLRFAKDPGTRWPGNFRDFGGLVLRLCTLAPRGRITKAMVEDEIEALRQLWRRGDVDEDARVLSEVLGPGALELDLFDQVQLAEVVRVCRRSSSQSDAGRALFAVSRTKRKASNDADRLRKYLMRFELDWTRVTGR